MVHLVGGQSSVEPIDQVARDAASAAQTAADNAANAASTAQTTANNAANAAASANTNANNRMPIAGGTFTGQVAAAYGAATNSWGIRNGVVYTSAGGATGQACHGIEYWRK